jgi:hypothetical protein
MRWLELTGDRRCWQQTAGPRDAAAVRVGQWRRVGLVCGGDRVWIGVRWREREAGVGVRYFSG